MAAAKKGGGGFGKIIVLLVVGLIGTAGGAAVPLLLTAKEAGHAEGDGHSAHPSKTAFIPFGDAVVNLAEERLTRYLRVKIVLVVSEADEKDLLKEITEKKKAILKNWLIGYLSDKSLKEVNGAANVNRLRREIQEQFNSLLAAGSVDKIHDVLFEEFVVQ